MIEHHSSLVMVLCIAALVLGTCIGTRVSASGLLVPVNSYQLEHGTTVLVWIDERYGLFCTMVLGTGLSCVPLRETTYGQQIGK